MPSPFTEFDMLTEYKWTPRALGSTWRCQPVPRGTSLVGVIAGPMRIVMTHYIDKRSQPCRHACTGGAVRCYCQDGATPKRVYGYLPLITAKDETVVVILSASVSQNVKPWAHGTAVEVIAPVTPKATTRCRQCLPATVGERIVDRVKGSAPVAIDEYLIHVLWHDQILIDYFNAEQKRKDKPATPPLIRRKQKDTDTPPPRSDTTVSLSAILGSLTLDPNAKQ